MSRREMSLDSLPGTGVSSNMALRGDGRFFSYLRGHAFRVITEELEHAHRAAWGVSPPQQLLVNLKANPGNSELKLQNLFEELEASRDLPSLKITDPIDGRTVTLEYRTLMSEVEQAAQARFEELGNYDKSTGYIKWTADEWLDSIYLENGKRRLPISSWNDRDALKAFVAGSTKQRLQLFEEQFDGLFRWSSTLAKIPTNTSDGVSREAISKLSVAAAQARLTVTHIRAINCGCLTALCG